jgi:N-acetylglucosamine malate deacetylase 1
VNRSGSPGGALFLLAHHDDEVFCAGCIARALRQSRPVRLLWATAGGLAPSGRRRREGDAVARLLGLRADAYRSLGLPDQGALDHLAPIGAALHDMLDGVGEVFVPAYEGGHPDHDAVNLVAARICAGLAVHEFSLYRRQRGVAVKAAFPREAQSFEQSKLDAEALRLRRALARANASQLPELLALGAVAALRGTLAREPVRTLPAHDYLRPPDGRPLYELYTRRRFAEFRAAAELFLNAPAH